MTVTFPNNNADILWAFNPNYITITGASSASVMVEVGGRKITVATYKGKAEVYISRLLQLAFDAPKTTRMKTISLKVGNTDTKSVAVVWGSLELGDRFSSFGAFNTDGDKTWHERHVQYFKNFPCTLDLACVPDDTLTYKIDGGSETSIDSVADISVKTLDLSGYNISRNMVINQILPRSIESLFDDTFDYTFYCPLNIDVVTKVFVRNETEGYYLRWIDRFGFMQYYLFDMGNKTLKSTLSNYSIEDATPFNDMRFSGHSRSINISTDVSVKACAVNLDVETLSYVESVVSSPIVDLYIGYHAQSNTHLWLPVTIASGSFSYNTRHPSLRDFEITINLPKRNTQTL